MSRPVSFRQIKMAAQAADDKKGQHIQAFDVRDLTSVTDAFLFVGATSHVHVKTLEDEIRKKLRETGAELRRTEGSQGHPWRVLDYGDFLVHVMDQSTREFYSLERLWSQGKPIKLSHPKKKGSKQTKKPKRKAKKK